MKGEKLFGKTLESLTYKDVEIFFSSLQVETDLLEFKSATVLDDKAYEPILKAVCAMLNSSGGIIVWGAPQKQKKGKEEIYQGSLTGFTEDINKDQVMNKLYHNITPIPNNIRAKELRENGKSIIVIEVESSEYAPHQTGHVYYMRLDGQSRPAPHHYIEALFKKVKYPNIEGTLNLGTYQIKGDELFVTFNLRFNNWSPLENEEGFTFRWITDQGKFVGLDHGEFKPDAPRYSFNNREYYKGVAKAILRYGETHFEQQTINISFRELKENLRIKLWLYFGGRFSPYKVSSYTLDLTGLATPTGTAKMHEDIASRLFKEVHDEEGWTKIDIQNRQFHTIPKAN